MIPRKNPHPLSPSPSERSDKLSLENQEVAQSPVLQGVYRVDWYDSLQYLNDQRYSYEDRVHQAIRFFEDNPQAWWEQSSLAAEKKYLKGDT